MADMDLQEQVELFRGQCIWLMMCRNTYSALFESDDETKEILFNSAPSFFFKELQPILHEYYFLQVCKITDPPGTRHKESLTSQYVDQELCRKGLMTAEIRKLSDKLLSYRKLVLPARHKIIAHPDKQTARLNQSLGKHSEQDQARFLDALQGYNDAVGTAVGVGPLDFRSTSGEGDVLDLIAVLARGLKCDLDEPNVVD